MGFMGQIGPNMGQNMGFMGFMDFMGRVDTLDQVLCSNVALLANSELSAGQ